jgi:hypothetical protein
MAHFDPARQPGKSRKYRWKRTSGHEVETALKMSAASNNPLNQTRMRPIRVHLAYLYLSRYVFGGVLLKLAEIRQFLFFWGVLRRR